MPVQLNSQTGSSEQVDETLRRKTSASVRVSMPGIIQSFDAENCTATVQPGLVDGARMAREIWYRKTFHYCRTAP